jgi:hypothetical protein
MFFLRRARPLELTAKRMRALRLSLNTPVVAIEDLPPGPARSAITLHAEPRDGLAVTVSVRSLGCGSVVHYGFEGTIGAVGEVMDAALSFAEGMGFLFDDELVGNDTASQEKALVRFSEAIGSGEGASPESPEEDAEPALELFELAGGDLTDPPVATLPAVLEGEGREAFAFVEPEPGASPGELRFRPAGDARPTVPLTKFRVRADTASAPEGKGTSEVPGPGTSEVPGPPAKRMLGRVRLERRRSNKLVQDARRSWLMRLVSCF